MKKLMTALAIAAFLLSAPATYAHQTNTTASYKPGSFMKSKTQTWEGMDNMWYKLDKSAKLWESKDGKKWAADADGMWQDKEGKWLKIGDMKLWWSADGGKTWSEVPEWKWEGPDGSWYKFDKDWTLWVTK